MSRFIKQLLAIEAASGIALLGATAAALVWANLWPGSYAGVWQAPHDWSHGHALRFWINDGLMALFFFVVGLEIRREIRDGELATLKKAALPIVAALGGMLVPAAIFAALNSGRAGSAGWAIPMATDIAFAVGVLTLLGSRVPSSLRVLLLALAVIDDIGAIAVIVIFYAGGIHPAIIGVVLGLLVPGQHVRERLIHWLHPWNAFVVMPVFALANAGVVIGGANLSGDQFWVFAGIVAGLVIGKPLGIAAAALGASRAGLTERSEQMTRRGVVLVGLVGGIGFTMSMFIAQLAFSTGPFLETAKLAILVGSGTAMLVGLAYGRATHRRG